ARDRGGPAGDRLPVCSCQAPLQVLRTAAGPVGGPCPLLPPCVPGQVSIRVTGRRPLAAWRRGSGVSGQAALPRVETSPCTAIAAIGASHKTPGSTSSDASE